jgi:hypothetical protein
MPAPSARARQNSLIFGTFLARTRAARAVNILVLDPFYSEDTLQRKLCLFLMASSINEWCSKCFGGGWGPLQNPKHGLKNSDASTKSKTWVKTGGGHPKWEQFGILKRPSLAFNPCLGFWSGQSGARKATRRRLARERRGASSSVVSIKTIYYKTTY